MEANFNIILSLVTKMKFWDDSEWDLVAEVEEYMLKEYARDYEMNNRETHAIYDYYADEAFEVIRNYLLNKYPELIEACNTIESISDPKERINKKDELKMNYPSSYHVDIIPLEKEKAL